MDFGDLVFGPCYIPSLHFWHILQITSHNWNQSNKKWWAAFSQTTYPVLSRRIKSRFIFRVAKSWIQLYLLEVIPFFHSCYYFPYNWFISLQVYHWKSWKMGRWTCSCTHRITTGSRSYYCWIQWRSFCYF